MDMAKSKEISSVKNNMMSMKKGKAARIVFVRLLIIALVDIVVSSLFDFVGGEAMREYKFHCNVHTPLKYVFGVLLVLSIAFLVYTIVKKIDTSAWLMTPMMITAVALYLFVTAMLYDRFRTTPYLFYTMTIVVSVLFAVYYIYTILMYKK
jgi:hypothetical protein